MLLHWTFADHSAQGLRAAGVGFGFLRSTSRFIDSGWADLGFSDYRAAGSGISILGLRVQGLVAVQFHESLVRIYM